MAAFVVYRDDVGSLMAITGVQCVEVVPCVEPPDYHLRVTAGGQSRVIFRGTQEHCERILLSLVEALTAGKSVEVTERGWLRDIEA